jgi:hypothetical protein
MELVAGYPFWFIKSGLPYQYPKLLENVKCQAAIIGGGISGALTAYHLINAGIECKLVDGRTIGLGCTCASTSLLQYELDIPLHKRLTQKRGVHFMPLVLEVMALLSVLLPQKLLLICYVERKTKTPSFFLFQDNYITFTFTKSGFFTNCRVYLKRILAINSKRQYSLKKFF